MTKAQFQVFASPQAAAKAAAAHIADVVRARPQTVLGLATGKTFVPVYAALVELAEARPGVPQDDPEARMRLRSIDVQLGRLLEESAAGRDGLIAELREDMAALTRAIRALEGRAADGRHGA